MYIAVCDDQIEELEKLTALLQAWQSDQCFLFLRLHF